jgi:electron transfer flavoprotein alpha subunit
MSLESLAAAQKMKKMCNGELHLVIFNNNLGNALLEYECDSVIILDNSQLQSYNPLFFVETFNQINNQINPDIFIFAHSYETRDWVPRISARLDIPFISDCTNFSFNEKFIFTRPIYQAKLNQNILLSSNQAIISYQAGSFSKDNLISGNSSLNTEISCDLSSVNNTIRPGEKFQESSGGVDLTAAELIVSVGRGIGKEENIPLAQNLADKLNAQIGSSRPVVDAGWLDHSRQIGSSGQTVSPKLYFAVGISGAIQHLVGMKGSKCIMAINKDPNAPIFEIADYAIVGDLLEILPKLTESI